MTIVHGEMAHYEDHPQTEEHRFHDLPSMYLSSFTTERCDLYSKSN
jgi:hypothetical protein